MPETSTSKPKFSILSMLLGLTVIGLGLAYISARNETVTVRKELADSQREQGYLKSELGYIESEDDSKFYLREMENQIPLARRYRVDFPHGYYNIVVGDHLGGEFNAESVVKRYQSKKLLRMTSNMSIHVHKDPKNEVMFSVDIVDFDSGQSGGGYMPDYKVNVNALNFSDDQHGQAVDWRIGNERPHGELQVYDASRIDQARMSRMTFASSTPVKRISSPWNLYVNRSWSMPNKCNIVAWKS